MPMAVDEVKELVGTVEPRSNEVCLYACVCMCVRVRVWCVCVCVSVRACVCA